MSCVTLNRKKQRHNVKAGLKHGGTTRGGDTGVEARRRQTAEALRVGEEITIYEEGEE